MLTCEEHDITTLSPEARSALAQQIFPVLEAIHSCETLEDFIKDYSSPCWAMSMAVYKAQGQVVAYARYKISDMTLDTERYKIVRLDISIHPEYKGKIPYIRFYFKESWRLREVLREKNLYALCLCLSPVPYYYIAKYYRALHPLPGQDDLQQERLLQRFLSQEGLHPAPERPHILKLLSRGFVETPEEKCRWAQHPSPFVAFYREQCPNYTDGEALAVLVQLTAPRLVVGLLRLLVDQSMKRVRRVLS